MRYRKESWRKAMGKNSVELFSSCPRKEVNDPPVGNKWNTYKSTHDSQMVDSRKITKKNTSGDDIHLKAKRKGQGRQVFTCRSQQQKPRKPPSLSSSRH